MDDAELKPSSSQLGSSVEEEAEEGREGRERGQPSIGTTAFHSFSYRPCVAAMPLPPPASDMTKRGRCHIRRDGAREREGKMRACDESHTPSSLRAAFKISAFVLGQRARLPFFGRET